MIRILVVDDEKQLLRALRINLTARSYQVATAADGAGALQAVAQQVPDLVVLDLGLPDMDGTTVIAGLRGWTKVPILVLSGRTDAAGKVDALDAGADDYVTKPFSMDELLARIRALICRAEPDGAAVPTAAVGHWLRTDCVRHHRSGRQHPARRPQAQRTTRWTSAPPEARLQRTRTGSVDCNNRAGDTGADKTLSRSVPGVYQALTSVAPAPRRMGCLGTVRRAGRDRPGAYRALVTLTRTTLR